MVSAERRLAELGLELPQPPTPFGAYVETRLAGPYLFLSGMLPVENHRPKYTGRIGTELTEEQGRDAARTATLGALAAARKHLGSLDRITGVVRLVVYLVCGTDTVNQPGIADAASELLRDVFGPERLPVRVVLGMASLPLSLPVEVEITFEVGSQG